MKRFVLPALLVTATTLSAMADYQVKGVVVDAQGEPLIGATVRVPDTNIAAAAGLDGDFTLNVPDGVKEIRIDYVGYEPRNIRVAKGSTGLRVVLDVSEQMLQDVVVTQSIARTRKTPVAVSTLDAPTIEAKLSN